MLVTSVTFAYFPTYIKLTTKSTDRIFKIVLNTVKVDELEKILLMLHHLYLQILER